MINTEIRDFDRLRVGQTYPCCLDISKISDHESYGVYAMTSVSSSNRVELRQKAGEVALFTFKYNETELPEWWKDSELIWSNQ